MVQGRRANRPRWLFGAWILGTLLPALQLAGGCGGKGPALSSRDAVAGLDRAPVDGSVDLEGGAPVGDSGLGAGQPLRILSAGAGHTCALQSDHTVSCWGANVDGELGDGTDVDRHTPGTVPGLSATGVLSGSYHNCATGTNGQAFCWGWNSYGQVGDGTITNRLNAYDLSSLGDVLSVAAGGYHSCAILSDGTGQCWGQNSDDELGDGNNTDSSTPVGVFSLPASVAVVAAGRHTCALATDGTVQCWGANDFGETGSGADASMEQVFPLPVSGLSNVVALAAGFDHNCALSSSGQVDCWGSNANGQLGNGTTVASTTPVAVAGLPSPATAITSGYDHVCAILTDASLWCWGSNSAGQLGDGTTASRGTPAAVPGLSAVKAATGGSAHTCAATTDGTVYCWGSNEAGELGDGTTTDHALPAVVAGVKV